MEEVPTATPMPPQQPAQVPSVQEQPKVCTFCHQPLSPSWYFCPNCGMKISSPPLSTSLATQAWIYAFSIILPIICYLLITKWPGLTYMRSKDPDAKRIGVAALALLIISSVVTLWLGTVWIENQIQSSVSQINSEMSY